MRRPSDFSHHPSPFPGGEYRGKCLHVEDGDTYDVRYWTGTEWRDLATTLRAEGLEKGAPSPADAS